MQSNNVFSFLRPDNLPALGRTFYLPIVAAAMLYTNLCATVIAVSLVAQGIKQHFPNLSLNFFPLKAATVFLALQS